MSLLIETIRLQNGRFNNLAGHSQRMHRAFKAIYNNNRELNLEEILNKFSIPESGLYKCRLVYDNKSYHAEFIPYEPRSVNTLKLIHNNEISYGHKFADRSALEHCFAERGICDDILIIQNQMVTDTSFSNIVFRKGDEWVTPSTFLLSGTMRQTLLDSGKINEAEIKKSDLPHFDSFKIINSMLMFEAAEQPVENILN